MNDIIFEEIIVLLTLAVFAIACLKRFNIAPILAYLVVGMIVSPYGLGLIEDNQDVRFIAEFGVVFLMFTVGLEFSLAKLIALKKEVLGLGGSQVLITSVIAGSIDWYFSQNIKQSIIIGGIIALSSTAIVSKQLSEQLELNSRHGHLALSILIFQDIAVIPFLVLIPSFAGDGPILLSLEISALLKGMIILLLMLAIGHWILRPLLRIIANIRSAELFTLSVLLIALAAAWATHRAGLSLALGSFIAGMMLSETEYRHQIEVDIRPFQDILLGLFFITVGMLLDLNALLPQLHWVILVAILLILTKTLIITSLSYLFGASPVVSFRTGLVLNQGGEFGFALMTLALTYNLLEQETTQIVLSAIILSMMLTPWIIHNNGRWTKILFRRSYKATHQTISQQVERCSKTLSEHVIICGYGHIGQNISRFIEEKNQHYIALDLDIIRIQEAQDAGETVVYGDPAHKRILQAAGVDKARAVLITIKNSSAAKKIIAQIRSLNKNIPILVRSIDESKLDELYAEGATEVIPETLESSIIMASHLLIHIGVPPIEITQDIAKARKDKYKFLRGYFPGEQASHEESRKNNEHINTLVLHPGAKAIGKTIGQIDLGGRNIVFTALRRGGIRGKQPSSDLLLKENDLLVMYAKPEDLEFIKVELMTGH
ncbi:MAG: cation:proton antiporter [gamma proteobacterium symbiont of Lucinoma myriamae]|nr:cation:proton antiporter [gamma proteobacterium symbiont of Lucinoma myriamae]MCU7817648.1 cation:proton antiporter [gamma proteobacterium symbiont of Lucinoma myriamae]MCU7832615.1 cation:proton antiporter [gamma proteobacterium symbiont of Lucinoma myriamae]